MTSTAHSPVRGLTVVIPAFNEAGSIAETLAKLKAALKQLPQESEIIVVDDGSRDATPELAAKGDVRVIVHPANSGYGRSLLTGIEAAKYNTIAIADADGTYPLDRLPELVAFYNKGFAMAVGARSGRHYAGGWIKSLLRGLFRYLAEFTCGRSIPDINSGFRIFDRRPVLQWRSSLSTGFSFTTTVTLLFMLNNLMVGYLPIPYHKRVGASKVRLLRDSLRSLQIIVTTIAQFNPLKLFLLLITFHVFGNGILFGLMTYYRWPPISSLSAFISWNSFCLLCSAAIFTLTVLKPSPVAATPEPPAR